MNFATFLKLPKFLQHGRCNIYHGFQNPCNIFLQQLVMLQKRNLKVPSVGGWWCGAVWAWIRTKYFTHLIYYSYTQAIVKRCHQWLTGPYPIAYRPKCWYVCDNFWNLAHQRDKAPYFFTSPVIMFCNIFNLNNMVTFLYKFQIISTFCFCNI